MDDSQPTSGSDEGHSQSPDLLPLDAFDVEVLRFVKSWYRSAGIHVERDEAIH